MAAIPMHQFNVYRIGPEIKIGQVDISFTNASLFMIISVISIIIIFHLGSKKKSIITPTNIFKIKLVDLYNSMITVFKYDNQKKFIMGYRDNEKQVEQLQDNQNIDEILQYNENDIIKLINDTLKETDISCL